MSPALYDALRWIATFVLWLLGGLFLASLGVAVWRWIALGKEERTLRSLRERVGEVLKKEGVDGLKRLETPRGFVGTVIGKALHNLGRTPEALNEVVEGEASQARTTLESGLNFLGTLGANAPFIGLFGTVLGIMAAFHDLAVAGHSGPSVVMAGLSEALVATAVGLLVAIPDVMMYNYLKNKVKKVVSGTEALFREILGIAIDHFEPDGVALQQERSTKVVRL